MKEKLIYSALFALSATWAFAIIGMTMFIFEGGRFTERDGKDLLERIESLESRVQVLEGVETEPLPVMAWIRPSSEIRHDGDLVTGRFDGFKQRPICDRVPDSEVGYLKDSDGVIAETGFRYVDDKTPNSSFSSGVVFDIGVIEWSGVSAASFVGFSILHECSVGPDKQVETVKSEFWFKVG